jgi:hypothetical protein
MNSTDDLREVITNELFAAAAEGYMISEDEDTRHIADDLASVLAQSFRITRIDAEIIGNIYENPELLK